MSDELKDCPKDRWDKFHIIMRACIPLIALGFTITFGIMEHYNRIATQDLTKSNLKLSKSRVKVSLLPSLSSKDASQRAMALYLAKALDESFAASIASVLAVSDPDEDVRKWARSALGSLSTSQHDPIKQKALKGVEKYDIMNELRSKELLGKLDDAQNYFDSGIRNGYKEALKLYRQVIEQLSPNAIKNLDKDLLEAAMEDEKGGHAELASRKYSALFSDYRQVDLKK